VACRSSLASRLKGVYGPVVVNRGATARTDKDLLARLQENVIDVARCDDGRWATGLMQKTKQAIQADYAAYQCVDFAGARRGLRRVKHPKVMS